MFEGVYARIPARNIIWGYDATLADKFNSQDFFAGNGLYYSPRVEPFLPNLRSSANIFKVNTGNSDYTYSGAIELLNGQEYPNRLIQINTGLDK